MPVKFKYAPTSGPLSGQAFEDQTEAAFNELGAVIDTIDLKAGAATDAAENAVAAANNALLIAEDAMGDAQAAGNTAAAAQDVANDAATTADAAMTRADAAYDTSTMASSRADAAVDAADAAQVASLGAEQTANDAAAMADAAQTTANSALALASQVAGGVPTGVICLWSGLVTAIPDGWALCNGSNGTPNLRDRFIVGAGSTYAPGATGGANTHTHTASAANTTAGTTIGATTLTVAQIPAHMHELSNGGKILSTGVGSTFLSSGSSGTSVQYGAYVDSTGGAGSHTHTATGTAHTHTVTVATGDNLPSYYALAYIMKL